MLDGGYEEDCRGGGVVGRNGLGRRTGDAEDGPRVYLKMGVGLGLAKGKETRKGHLIFFPPYIKKGHLIWVRHQTLRIGTLCGAARAVRCCPRFSSVFSSTPFGFSCWSGSLSQRGISILPYILTVVHSVNCIGAIESFCC